MLLISDVYPGKPKSIIQAANFTAVDTCMVKAWYARFAALCISIQ